ncbi:MAG: hypothetical protein K6T83_23710 [Alicyclobacillus sp.]|nr:hypothetical protein [Alicyclobacillus sp.]
MAIRCGDSHARDMQLPERSVRGMKIIEGTVILDWPEEFVTICVKRDQPCGIKSGEVFSIAGYTKTHFYVWWSPSIMDQIYSIPREDCTILSANVEVGEG